MRLGLIPMDLFGSVCVPGGSLGFCVSGVSDFRCEWKECVNIKKKKVVKHKGVEEPEPKKQRR